MSTFKDKLGFEWQVNIDMLKALEIENYNFGQAFGDPPLEDGTYPFHRLNFIEPDDDFFDVTITKTRIVFTILWILCREQAKIVGVTNLEEFAKRFDGDSMTAAKMAFYEELPNFFTSRRTVLKTSIQRYLDALEELDRVGSQMLEENLSREDVRKLVRDQLGKVTKEIQKTRKTTDSDGNESS